MKILLVIFVVSITVISGCKSVSDVEKFKQKTLSIKVGASPSKVKEILGSPDYIKKDNYNKLLSRLESDTVWGFFHPEYATVSFVVGFKHDKVKKLGIYHADGFAAHGPIIGRVETLNDFWKSEEARNSIQKTSAKPNSKTESRNEELEIEELIKMNMKRN